MSPQLAVCRHADARAFLDRAERWLLESEIENGLVLGIAHQAAKDPARFGQPAYFATIEHGRVLHGCAFRTPPHQVAVTSMPLDAIGSLAAELHSLYGSVPGVSGPQDPAVEFAGAWAALTGTEWTLRFRQRIYAARAIASPPARGALRLAGAEDIGLANDWAQGFVDDTGVPFAATDFGERLVRDGRLYLWHDGGPRAMVASARETANVAWINAVYTPPEFRRQGFASAAVAALSRRLLDEGRTHCALYADLANPTSNSIYQQIGYAPIQDAIDIKFEAAAEGAR